MIILVMGAAGSGKTTVGRGLAARLGWEFLEGDDFHASGNIEKMRRGEPLGDADRAPWLESLHEALARTVARGSAVLACSALKQSYRDRLCAGLDARVVYLKGSYELLRARMESRTGHFAGEGILRGQFADLEEPGGAICIAAELAPEAIVNEVCRRLGLM